MQHTKDRSKRKRTGRTTETDGGTVTNQDMGHEKGCSTARKVGCKRIGQEVYCCKLCYLIAKSNYCHKMSKNSLNFKQRRKQDYEHAPSSAAEPTESMQEAVGGFMRTL